MCCFGIRVLMLFFITFASIFLHKFFPLYPALLYYFILANLLSITMLLLYFSNKLPEYFKPQTLHYFSLIGGFLMMIIGYFYIAKKFDKFLIIEILIAIFWGILFYIIGQNFTEILEFVRVAYA
ncbi:hypothetical protein LMG7974_01318 [Campylobacter majalis]|uniref:Uncharacterized protein n=2 Tax=Campylobacter majalis TaxID=2790656 RepID=A0ABN7K9K8_9BACT|nr:hypothetical protein LMG7974_01318 [Campylobacter majalis]